LKRRRRSRRRKAKRKPIVKKVNAAAAERNSYDHRYRAAASAFGVNEMKANMVAQIAASESADQRIGRLEEKVDSIADNLKEVVQMMRARPSDSGAAQGARPPSLSQRQAGTLRIQTGTPHGTPRMGGTSRGPVMGPLLC
jgi:hypothetical protein